MTAKTRGRRQSEEKHAIIKGIQQKESVVERRRNDSVDPTIYYRRKESCDTFGIDSFKSHYRRMEPSVRKLIKENSRPKKPLAERDLTVKMLSEALKKEDRKEMSTLASEYMGRGVGPTVAAGLLHIPRCTPTEHLYNSLPGREGGILKSYSE